MAIRARVELRGSLTHDHGGRVFKKGSPQILTNAAEIKYYQGQAGFSVTMLEGAKAKAPAPVVDDDTGGESDNDYSEADLRKMKKAELVEIAEELELDTEGTVNELIDRILEAQ